MFLFFYFGTVHLPVYVRSISILEQFFKVWIRNCKLTGRIRIPLKVMRIQNTD
jgi:hypothetical protein